MAVYHGEIMLPDSRAVDEEDDEDEVPTLLGFTPFVADWSEVARTETLDCTSLIVAVGAAPTGFVSSYIIGDQETEELGRLGQTSEEGGPEFSASSLVLRLTSQPEVVIAQCTARVMPEQSFSWTQELMTKVGKSVKNVYIFSTNPAAEFKSDTSPWELEVPFLRSLKSAKSTDDPRAPILEQPNTVVGLPAQVMSYCEVHGLPATLYQCYTDTMYIDIHTIKAFCPVLESPPIKKIAKVKSKIDENLRSLVDQQAKENALLYI